MGVGDDAGEEQRMKRRRGMQPGRNEAKGTSHRREADREESDGQREEVTGDEIHKVSSSCPRLRVVIRYSFTTDFRSHSLFLNSAGGLRFVQQPQELLFSLFSLSLLSSCFLY